ncbi:MAG: SDR family oxidoreductase [Herpetosiphon sp.]
MDVRGKIVIMTGASAGIGLASARLLARHGAHMVLAARSLDKLTGLSAEMPGSFAVEVDMRKSASIKTMIDAVIHHFGRIDILVNNAGQGMYGPLEHADLRQYREIMELNVFGPLEAMQLVIPIMRQQGGGMIVNISSGVSKMYLPELGGYASTKYALNALTLTLRAELAADAIKVSIVYPGRTATDFGKNSNSNQAITAPTASPSDGTQANRPSYPGARPGLPPADTAELVAEKILEAIQTEVAEQYMSEEQRLQVGRMAQPV